MHFLMLTRWQRMLQRQLMQGHRKQFLLLISKLRQLLLRLKRRLQKFRRQLVLRQVTQFRMQEQQLLLLQREHRLKQIRL